MDIPAKYSELSFGIKRIAWHKKFFGVIKIWHRNSKTRRHLRELPDDILQDIGLKPSDVDRECSKHFYQ